MCGGKDPSPPPPARLHTLSQPSSGVAAQPHASAGPLRQSGSRPQSKSGQQYQKRERPHPGARGDSQPTARPYSSSYRPSSMHGDLRSPSSSDRERSSSQRRPQTHHASTSRRPHTHSGPRPQRRPQSYSRPSSSHWGEPRVQSIPEQFTEDATIINSVSQLSTFINQHVELFYPHGGVLGTQSSNPELEDPRTQHAAIRQHIARTIIGLIATSKGYGTTIRGIIPEPTD
jgi:hypothetical protein